MTEAVIAYPTAPSASARVRVEVVIHDFSFRGSHARFSPRVIDNLRNALRSLQVAGQC